MNLAIILSGGIGSRMKSDRPKQYLEVNGKPIMWYCLKTFIQDSNIHAIVIVTATEWKEYVMEQVDSLSPNKPVHYALPGETRQYSIYNALLEIKHQGYDAQDCVIIHDAARPLVSHQLIYDCLDSCRAAEAILPVIPVKDTLYRSTDGQHITSLLNRQELFAGQAPEAFVFGPYLELHKKMPHKELLKINGSTEIAYKGGMKVKLIKGDEMNFKITTQEDLSNFENILKKRTI